jgi:hypothetical protein
MLAVASRQHRWSKVILQAFLQTGLRTHRWIGTLIEAVLRSVHLAPAPASLRTIKEALKVERKALDTSQ